ncbi:acyltransferase [Sphingomonas oleivorans]|uniref:Acyltransferase n=1 Tax=Sphingomonas oleivorans TaxID=1735121 RepID=A0A2T5G1W7_9SPHN|nr:acyltransferase family protein [Sphingomonas oleivorans]PTQ13143.1 acyltransferase [Sphingomonas oleivorans]
MKYRSDIDGLRAVAVLSVILFHIGFRVFSGGYVGVDVFFVISGYLITAILKSDAETGQFSIVKFYERRIRRIFPALFCMMLATSIVALLIFLPDDLAGYGGSVWAATLSVSNILFWDQADYFDAPAEMKPLLHTWSLSVEEQFYLFFPLFLILAYRYGSRRFLSGTIIAVALTSFALSIWAADRVPVAAFYLLPTRAWELLLGSILALGIVPPLRSRPAAEACGMAGLALIAIAVFTYDSKTIFPGLAALPPCLGAVLIIHSGQHLKDGLAQRILGSPPARFIGLISFSLYLWHWPLIVFAKYLSIDPLATPVVLLVLTLTFVLAYLSWRFVEQPFRHPGGGWTRARIFTFGFASMIAAVIFGGSISLAQGFPGRMPEQVLRIADEKSYLDADRSCHQAFLKQITAEKLCIRGASGRAPSFLLVGDSHAGAVAGSVFEAAARKGLSGVQLSDSGYRPMPGFLKHGEQAKYAWMHKQLVRVLEERPSIRTVLVVIYWHQAVDSTEYYNAQGRRLSGRDGTSQGLTALVNAYPDRHFIFMTAPAMSMTFGANPAARAALFGYDYAPSVPLADFHAMEASYRPIMADLAQHANVDVMDITNLLCGAGGCSGLIGGQLAYRDNNHLSTAAARALIPAFEAALTMSHPPAQERLTLDAPAQADGRVRPAHW